jgi:hypothetical protein
VTRWISAALLAGATATTVSACGSGSTADQPTTSAKTTTTKAVTTSAPPAPSLADVVSEVRDGVIRIEAGTCDGTATGTGFLLSPRLIATVEHVVDGSTQVKLKQGKKLVGRGTVIGVDRDRDVALIRTSAPIDGHVFEFADSAPRLGDSVAALGFPLGLPLSVTSGSVSGDGRTVPIDGLRRRGLIQTDASLNPGNSGGPLIDKATGKVVGLVDIGTDAHGISFAVNAKVAAALLEAWQAAPQPVPAADCFTPNQGEGQYTGGDDLPTRPAPADATDAEVYDGREFSIAYPAAWHLDTAEAPKSFGSDTTIIDPTDDSRLIRVDVSPSASGSASDQAKPVIATLRRAPSYTELDLSPMQLNGYDALHWEFQITEGGRRLHKEDVFLIDDYGRGVAILTQAGADDYAAVAEAFAEIRQSFVAY